MLVHARTTSAPKVVAGVLLAVALVMVSQGPAAAGRDTASWTVERTLDQCVHAGVSLFTVDHQGGKSKTYCLDLTGDIGFETRSILITAFPSRRPASLRLMVVSGCRLETSFPRFDAKTHINVDALEAAPGRKTRDRNMPEPYDGRFKVGRFKVYCRGLSAALSATEGVSQDTSMGQSPRDTLCDTVGLASAERLGPIEVLITAESSTAAAVADWIETRFAPDGPMPDAAFWRALPADLPVGICTYTGGPFPAPSFPGVPPYDMVRLLVPEVGAPVVDTFGHGDDPEVCRGPWKG